MDPKVYIPIFLGLISLLLIGLTAMDLIAAQSERNRNERRKR